VGARQTCWIATINVQHLCLAERNPSFRKVLSRADVLTADGMPIVWLSRLMGRPLKEQGIGGGLEAVPLRWRAWSAGARGRVASWTLARPEGRGNGQPLLCRP
jgi:N-acetylglucosaminyldiphosphoundecaprenol N-acetyl-beta-D-mannosaminyltransferase